MNLIGRSGWSVNDADDDGDDEEKDDAGNDAICKDIETRKVLNHV